VHEEENRAKGAGGERATGSLHRYRQLRGESLKTKFAQTLFPLVRAAAMALTAL